MLLRRALVVGRGAAADAMAADLSRMRDVVVSLASDGDAAALERLSGEQDVVVSAAAPAHAVEVLRRVIEAKCPVADLGAPLPQARALDALAREKQLAACVRCGELPHLLGFSSADEKVAALVTTALARRLLTGDFRPHWGVWTPERVAARAGMAHGIREDLRERGVEMRRESAQERRPGSGSKAAP